MTYTPKVTEEEYNFLIDIIREDNPLKTEVAIPSYTEKDFLNEPLPKFGVMAHAWEAYVGTARQPLKAKNHLARFIGEIVFCRKLPIIQY